MEGLENLAAEQIDAVAAEVNEIGEKTPEVFSDMPLPSFLEGSEVSEFAPGMEVQAVEIKDVFLEFPELQYDEWKELDLDQRTEVLNAFEEKIAEIEMRDAVPVHHEETEPGLLGYHNSEGITISDSLVGDDSYKAYKETLETLFHEGRHAYQHYNIDVKQTESNSELVNAWRTNFEEMKYQSGTNIFGFATRMGLMKYYTQPVEVDARVFAEAVINKLGV